MTHPHYSSSISEQPRCCRCAIRVVWSIQQLHWFIFIFIFFFLFLQIPDVATMETTDSSSYKRLICKYCLDSTQTPTNSPGLPGWVASEKAPFLIIPRLGGLGGWGVVIHFPFGLLQHAEFSARAMQHPRNHGSKASVLPVRCTTQKPWHIFESTYASCNWLHRSHDS